MEIRLEQDHPRLDRFLTEAFPAFPRSRWEAWIREGRVSLEGRPVTKPGTRLRAGERLETELPPPSPPALHVLPEQIELSTLFEDDRLWIVDKPADMVVHPGPGHAGGTVLNAFLARLAAPALDLAAGSSQVGEDEEGPLPWPGLVHRLDRFTTGCLLLAKDSAAQSALQAQFKARSVEKRYLALARDGRKLPQLGSLLVDEPLARHRTERLKMVVSAGGRPAQTRIRVLARQGSAALLECELLTGRTHQIRVHLRQLGTPIFGDALYGGPPSWLAPDHSQVSFRRPMLHAWRLEVDHPGDGRRIQVVAPIPEDFRTAAAALGLELPG